MTGDERTDEPKELLINQIERDAIDFAQSLLANPKKGRPDRLSKIERDAINFARNLLAKFKN